MQTRFESDSAAFIVSGIPDGTQYVRAYANGVPTWRADVHAEDEVCVPLADLLPADPNVRSMVHGDDGLFHIVAYDAAREELARLRVGIPPGTEWPCTRAPPTSAPEPGPKRLVASNLQRAGEQHTWRIRIADHLPPPQRGGIRMVCLRATFDRESGKDVAPVVRWSHSALGDDAVTPSVGSKRPRMAAALGEQSAVARLHNGAAESLFHFLLATDDTQESQATVTVEWPVDQALTDVSGGLRYGVYLQLLPFENGASLVPYTLTEPSVRPGKRLAVIVGVSKYSRKRGGDLDFCDEDGRPRSQRKKRDRRRECLRVVRFPERARVRNLRLRG